MKKTPQRKLKTQTERNSLFTVLPFIVCLKLTVQKLNLFWLSKLCLAQVVSMQLNRELFGKIIG